MADLGKFVHLHVHSQFSMLDGANHLSPMVKRVKDLGMGSIALTDHGNLFGALAFQKACQKGGIKPILGSEVYLAASNRKDRSSPLARTRFHFLLLCKNLEGYRNLSRLVSTAFLEGFYYKPRIDFELLEKYHEGLVATTTCIQGPVCQAILGGNMAEAQRLLDNFLQIFGRDNFFVEIMDHGLPDQKKLNDGLLEIARKNDLPLIATNDCHYLRAEDYDLHDVLLCIQMGKQLQDEGRMRFEQNEFYIKSPDEMIQLFGHLNGAIENTLKIAEMCDCQIPLRQKLLPKFRTPNGESSADYLRHLTMRGVERRYGTPPPPDRLERAEFELGVINRMGFDDYFLVVQEFINWAKERDIPVGPGRGSGAGSLVAYSLGITDLDPIPHGLLFERFLNPERVSMPDFDIDFCQERRGEVIEHVRDLYGKDCVAQIITFGTLKAKNAIRDVGRVMALPLQMVDQAAKCVPDGPKITLSYVIGDIDESKFDLTKEDDRKKLEDIKKQFSQQLREMYDADPVIKELIDRARGIEGAIRQPGTHAAGVVICDQPLIDLVPLYLPTQEEAMPATQFTMTEVEELGLLKMDFLGLKNLTLIKHCLDTVNERTGQDIKPGDIPLEDSATYTLLQQGKGLGVFQLESSGMRDLLVKFKPQRFSDLVALISLYRPGPMDNIPDFIARKEGRQEITYAHPDMEPILRETYGLFVYQEQVMQVAQVLGGYSLGGADLLRRAMSKKKAEAMAEERVKFVAGCATRQISESRANEVFGTMEKFAAYGFNKSHAAAYAVVTVQTAWLKAHYPADFYAALITNEIGGDDAKISAYFEEAAGEGLKILPPDINTSGLRFAPLHEDAGPLAPATRIGFGLVAIKGVGEGSVKAIIEERKDRGRFDTVQDFIARIEKKSMNSRTMECLIRCGAFDAFGHNRPSLLAALPQIMELAGADRRDKDDPQTSLFDMMDEAGAGGAPSIQLKIPRLPDWSDTERLDEEKKLAGFYLTGHPLDRYKADFDAFSTHDAAGIAQLRKGEYVDWVGLIKRLVPRTDKNGRMFAFIEAEDISGPMECTFFSDAFGKYRELLKEGEVIWVHGKVDEWKDAKKILVNECLGIDQMRAERIRALEVQLPLGLASEATLTRIRELMTLHKGRRRLWFLVREAGGECRIEAGNGYGITPSTALIRGLQDIDGLRNLRFIAKSNGREED